jgi:hypothetical protein
MARNGLASVDMGLAIGARAGWFGCYRLVVFSTLVAAAEAFLGVASVRAPEKVSHDFDRTMGLDPAAGPDPRSILTIADEREDAEWRGEWMKCRTGRSLPGRAPRR